jgi:hypothetical protein
MVKSLVNQQLLVINKKKKKKDPYIMCPNSIRKGFVFNGEI